MKEPLFRGIVAEQAFDEYRRSLEYNAYVIWHYGTTSLLFRIFVPSIHVFTVQNLEPISQQ